MWKKKNKICGLEDGNGRWIEEADEVEKMFCEYFTNIFTTTTPTPDHLVAAVADLPTRSTGEMESHLDQPFTEGEVAAALT